MLYAIAGASGSGKSTLAKELIIQKYGEANCLVLSIDDFYRDQSHLSFEARKLTNYDHPNSIELDLCCRVLGELLRGKDVECPQYDYSVHNRKTETKTLTIKPIIIVEGIFSLYFEAMRKLFNVMIYVDTHDAECKKRRIKRDVEERGRTIAEATAQYENTVYPMFLEHVAPCKKHADIVVSNSDVHADLEFDVTAVVAEIDSVWAAKLARTARIQSQIKLFGKSRQAGVPVVEAASSAPAISARPA